MIDYARPAASALVVLAQLLIAGANASAQSPAWLGVPPPPGLTPPPQLGVLQSGSFTASAAVVPQGDARHTELEGERIRRLLEQIVSFSHQSRASGELMWGRISGISGAAPTVEWVGQRFREAGLHSFPTRRSSDRRKSVV